jgi:hypothetical protein
MLNVLENSEFISPGGATCNSLGRQPQVELRREFPAPEGRHTQLRDKSSVAPPGLFNCLFSIPGADAPGYYMPPRWGLGTQRFPSIFRSKHTNSATSKAG